jgi:hypothetical protein
MSLEKLLRRALSAAADLASRREMKNELGQLVDSRPIRWSSDWTTSIDVYRAAADEDARLILNVLNRFEAYALIDTGKYAGTMAESTFRNWRRLLGEERGRRRPD